MNYKPKIYAVMIGRSGKTPAPKARCWNCGRHSISVRRDGTMADHRPTGGKLPCPASGLAASGLTGEADIARLAQALRIAADLVDSGSAYCSDCDRGARAPDSWRRMATRASVYGVVEPPRGEPVAPEQMSLLQTTNLVDPRR